MAADAILQIDMKELNENTVRQEEILDELNIELENQKRNLEINLQNNIDHRTYEEKLKIENEDFQNIEILKDEDRKKEIEEKKLISEIISRYKENED